MLVTSRLPFASLVLRFLRRLSAPVAVGAILALNAGFAGRAEAVKVASWNILNYPGSTAATREPYFRTIIQQIHPDVLVTQEMTGSSSAGQTQFLNNVLNTVFPGEYAVGTWIDGPDTDNSIFYRTAAFTLVSVDTISTNLRNIGVYVVRPAGYSSSAAELRLHSMHLKAGSTGADQTQRLEECTRLRNAGNLYPAGTHFIYTGDYNMQSSTETAYGKLTGSEADNDGRGFDPINQPGTWNNASGFADIHTQSTMTTNPYGGATGGMDDRFDIMLVSSAMLDNAGLSYVSGTYDAYGQDGNHFNLAIDDPPTIPEGATIATALANTSDHLPMVMEVQLPARVSADASLAFGTVIVGALAEETLDVSNTASTPADELNYSLVAPVGFTVPGGPFVENAGGGGNAHTVTMLTATAGVKGGNLVLSSNDVDTPSLNVPLSGTVLRHAVPSLAAGVQTLGVTADFGTHPEGGFSDQGVSVHNVGYDAIQALLNVYDAQLTGSARFSIVGGFNPGNVGGAPSGFTLHFNDAGGSGAVDSVFTGTLVFSTRDQQGIPGATNLSPLTVDLTATVEASQTGVGDPGAPLVTRLFANVPNPFRASTRVAFDLAAQARVSLAVYDVLGRRVRTLVNGDLAPGPYEILWNGRDDNGRETSPGIYFAIFESGTYQRTQRLVRIR